MDEDGPDLEAFESYLLVCAIIRAKEIDKIAHFCFVTSVSKQG